MPGNNRAIIHSMGRHARVLAGQDGGRRRSGWLFVPGRAEEGSGPRSLVGPTLPGWEEMFPQMSATAGNPATAGIVLGTFFPDSGWDPLLRAAAISGAFATSPDWHKETDPGHWGYKTEGDEKSGLDEAARLGSDLASMWKDMLERRLPRELEIQEQADDISPYWANLLACSDSSRPATWSLVMVGLQIAGLVAAYHKMIYKRARPVQVLPSIAPTISTPPHPSYPSGHGLQGLLIAELVKLAAPSMAAACDILGARIGENREIAGVHFPSDTRASKRILPKIIKILIGEGQTANPSSSDPDQYPIKELGAIVKAARIEWEGSSIAQTTLATAGPPARGPQTNA